ncbi:4Fe-4S dicluster domain-containing protein [Photobacterium phosphoreum]|uniref:4Fe-4S dicluster domain-containing protein n=1 Tax=Photobacterium phosphoreum TaxID=659 RepID=UPI0010098E02|nr:4Fe-4S dicluster domain-containing protein [Photobacterium phosphoreum]
MASLYCGECQQICPTKALSSSIADTEYRPVFGAGCLNRVSGQCQTCVEQCPQQALTIHDNQQPQLDSRLCNGCGLCRASCYIGAVTLGLVG